MLGKAKILIYDDENISYKEGWLENITIHNEPIKASYIEDISETYIPPMYSMVECSVSNYEELKNIELDDTTMKRIAKFNKEIDIKKLDEEIKKKKEKIKELDDILTDKVKRVDKIKKFIADIYEIDIDDDYDYED